LDIILTIKVPGKESIGARRIGNNIKTIIHNNTLAMMVSEVTPEELGSWLRKYHTDVYRDLLALYQESNNRSAQQQQQQQQGNNAQKPIIHPIPGGALNVPLVQPTPLVPATPVKPHPLQQQQQQQQQQQFNPVQSPPPKHAGSGSPKVPPGKDKYSKEEVKGLVQKQKDSHPGVNLKERDLCPQGKWCTETGKNDGAHKDAYWHLCAFRSGCNHIQDPGHLQRFLHYYE